MAGAGQADPGSPRRIVVGLGADEGGEDALALARTIADCTGAGVVPVTVAADPAHRRRGSALDPDAAEAIAANVRNRVGDARTVTARSVTAGLDTTAEQRRADLLVLGSPEQTPLGRVGCGPVARSVLAGAPCAVALAPRGYAAKKETTIRVIDVGFDAQEESELALRFAASLAGAARATMRVIAVGTIVAEQACPDLPARLAEAVRALPHELRASHQYVDAGSASHTLRDEADKGADVLVVGSRGRGPVRCVLLGSVGWDLVHDAPCAVVVVPRGAREAGSLAERPGPPASAAKA